MLTIPYHRVLPPGLSRGFFQSLTITVPFAPGWKTAAARQKQPPRNYTKGKSELSWDPKARKQAAAIPELLQSRLAYVKFVTEKVKDDELRDALGAYGKITYFDLNRGKNCTYLQYASASACLAAVKASPLMVSGQVLVVEQRLPKWPETDTPDVPRTDAPRTDALRTDAPGTDAPGRTKTTRRARRRKAAARHSAAQVLQEQQIKNMNPRGMQGYQAAQTQQTSISTCSNNNSMSAGNFPTQTNSDSYSRSHMQPFHASSANQPAGSFPIQNNSDPYNRGPMQPFHASSADQPAVFGPNVMRMPMTMPTTQPLGYFTAMPGPFDGHTFTGSRSTGKCSQNGQYASVPAQAEMSHPPASATTNSGRAKGSKRRRQEITRPSQESGGVPEPTNAYMMRASFMPQRNPYPGPVLVVIDLNGTLLHRATSGSHFVARAHAETFVKYMIDTFFVVIWSSARPENVNAMVRQLIPEPQRSQVVAIWGRDKFGLSHADYTNRTQCYKRLTKLWDDPKVRASYPSYISGFEYGRWDQGNTVLIDDSAEKARSEPYNAVTIPEYTGGRAPGDEKVLPAVHDYINELCFQNDVSVYIRANPFEMGDWIDSQMGSSA